MTISACGVSRQVTQRTGYERLAETNYRWADWAWRICFSNLQEGTGFRPPHL